jgi:hypothetical protein
MELFCVVLRKSRVGMEVRSAISVYRELGDIFCQKKCMTQLTEVSLSPHLAFKSLDENEYSCKKGIFVCVRCAHNTLTCTC